MSPIVCLQAGARSAGVGPGWRAVLASVLGTAAAVVPVAGLAEPALIGLAAQTYPVSLDPLPEALPEPARGPGEVRRAPVRVVGRLAPDPSIWRPAWSIVPAHPPQARSRAIRLPFVSVDLDAWSRGTRDWRYRSSAGYGLAVGNLRTGLSDERTPVRLAGVNLQGEAVSDRALAGGWQYALTAGALDATAGDTAASGGLDYGPTAYDLAARYEPAQGVSVGSHVQGTAGLLDLGLRGRYTLSHWGTALWGVSHASTSDARGWQHRLGYAFDLPSGWDLSWERRVRESGYANLATLDPADRCECVGGLWSLGAPLGRFGHLAGTYERQVQGAGVPQQRLGLVQQVEWGRGLRLRFEANRALETGQFGVGARFSVPLI